jgi:ATP phosphoribosyltransferase regulatory subunit
MLMTLQAAGVRNVQVDIGHVGIYRGLIRKLDITPEQESVVFCALQKKSTPELKQTLQDWGVSAELSAAVVALIDLHGGLEVLDEARETYGPVDRAIVQCVDELRRIAELTVRHVRDASLMFDLADLRGYNYHNGMTFTAYMQGQGQGIAFGGRYDGIGRGFGRSRPATGFSADVKLLFDLVARPEPVHSAIFAPVSAVPGLYEAINSLRNSGERVIYQLPGQAGDARAMGCDRELVLEAGKWKVRKI